jgi:hypothetical protein
MCSSPVTGMGAPGAPQDSHWGWTLRQSNGHGENTVNSCSPEPDPMKKYLGTVHLSPARLVRLLYPQTFLPRALVRVQGFSAVCHLPY